MNQRDRLMSQLKQARQVSEGLFASFQKPEDWTYQVHPKANHPLWVAGHLSYADNFFISILEPSRVRPMDGFDKVFGMGSVPTGDPGVYPDPQDVLAYMRERRETLLDILANMPPERLDEPTAEGAPDFMPDVASVFETAIWHEGMHSGQVTVARRGLGHEPLFTPGG